ncbi:sigma-54 interaction domain-containing protein [Brevibacillus brevis]|uniref:sigma-54 interaction domain-containing protein n=1 Tax=Brevibacillus brevis TaxID=1393 RepID=UPI001159ACC5|nr:sigma 54-interacting transcriptional regulator [Lysinibacillus sp. SDF0063]TQR33902.1 AAA family ATPase [Lysinibacillus sp. SDF0063]
MLLSSFDSSSAIERSQHRAISHAVFHSLYQQLQATTNLSPYEFSLIKDALIHLLQTDHAIPALRHASHSVPNWKSLLFAWAENSQECLIALSDERSVLFANKRAKERFSLVEGLVLEADWEQERLPNWYVEELDLGEKTWYRLFLIRPDTSTLSKTTSSYSFSEIHTNSPLYQAQLHTARIAAQSLSNTLLLGETGCGKEVLARAIHSSSSRKDGPFLAVNIAALPRELIASELFGYAEGAFTGAKKGGQPGKFEAANGGTLFLDEIGEMSLELQVLLLRVLEERKVTRLGSHEEKPLDIRVIAATNRSIEEDVQNGLFRADLYYRLNILQIRIPPLRERKEDIAALANEFLQLLHTQYAGGPTGICESALAILQQHSWPGNIRELRNIVERAFLHAYGDPWVTSHHLPSEWQQQYGLQEASSKPLPLLRELERQTIQQAITEAPSISAAAKKLGIARSTLYRKMEELGIG